MISTFPFDVSFFYQFPRFQLSSITRLARKNMRDKLYFNDNSELVRSANGKILNSKLISAVQEKPITCIVHACTRRKRFRTIFLIYSILPLTLVYIDCGLFMHVWEIWRLQSKFLFRVVHKHQQSDSIFIILRFPLKFSYVIIIIRAASFHW